MLKCKTCIHKKDIPGDAHYSCTKPSAMISGINYHGVENGWFMWPINFDPTWAEDCIGYADINEKLEEKDILELQEIFAKEFHWFKTLSENKFQYTHPLNIPKIEEVFNDYLETVKDFPTNFNNWTKENLIEAIQKIRKV